jgi:hypothetical protein
LKILQLNVNKDNYTEDSSLKGGEYKLWLSNRQTLYGDDNLAIAPGYKNQ